jgi:hypothetical protein
VPKVSVIFKNGLHLLVVTIFEGYTSFGLLEGKSGTTTERVRVVLGFSVDCCCSQHENDSSGTENLHCDVCFIVCSKDRMFLYTLQPFTHDNELLL